MKSSKFRFKKPELTNLSFGINDDFNNDLSGMDIVSKTVIKKNKERADAVVTFELEIGNENTPFYIVIAMKSDFKWDASIDESLIEKLLKTNAPSLLLSYMRPIISIITSNSQYPTLNVPFMDMTDNIYVEIE